MEDETLSRGEQVQNFILAHVDDHSSDIASFTAEHFDVTRQAIHQHLQTMERAELLVSEGQTRNKRYRRPLVTVSLPTDGLSEHDVYLEHIQPLLAGLPKNVISICEYGVTEMVNNVIDHSGSRLVGIAGLRTGNKIILSVDDTGVGIFQKIQQDCKLDDPRLAVFELTKGKLTTDPSRHTGEGIFFTSRMFDMFTIASHGLFLGHRRDGNDWLLHDPTGDEEASQTIGTSIRMTIQPDSTHTTQEVFDKYAVEQDDYAFSKTHVVVQLASTGEASFVSRSQAKRVLARLETFKEVLLDFEGVEEIGPAFSDEIFRVWSSQHGHVHLVPVTMNEQVTKMVTKALSHKDSGRMNGGTGRSA